jgi:hypothetical protein
LKFDTRIVGIPCQIEVTFYEPFCSGKRGHIDNWSEDEPEYLEFDVLDRNGRKAPWLERKMSADDYQRVQKEALNNMRAEV